MTRQESFKRRIRARMAKTGEKYGAARRVLIEQANADDDWVSSPETSDEAVLQATGRGWNEWRRLIDAGPGREADHGELVDFVRRHGVAGWWSQSVAVGYERITGVRLPHQQPDGTFTAGKTRTVSVDGLELRQMLLNDGDRADLFGGMETELRSAETSKVLRIGVGPGVAQIAITARDGQRATVNVTHEKLPDPASVNTWKAFWEEWLEAIEES